MASITIRGLDDDLKQRLRLRAARNGRSMEDEVRTILRETAAGADRDSSPAPRARGRRPRRRSRSPSRAAAGASS